MGPIIGHCIAVEVRAEALLPETVARARREAGVEWPKKGQTAEKRRSEVTCMISVWVKRWEVEEVLGRWGTGV